MQKSIWNRKVDWIISGSTSPYYYYKEERSELYNENEVIAVGDIYFRLNKYLTGVTFTYINRLEQISGNTYYTDIYKIDPMTGDGYSLVNMYNEYDVIDRVMKNIVLVDVAADTNIELTAIDINGKIFNVEWEELNDVKLKPGHLVLLKNQTLSTENDIYRVSNNNTLVNAGFLSTREKSEKFSCGVKLGKNFDKQFFLVNTPNENYFPIYFEPKTFVEGKSHLIKNLINYNLFSSSTGSTLKIIFTDYEVARQQLMDGFEHYYEIFVTGMTFTGTTDIYATINYHHDNSYIIRSGTTNSSSFTGITSEILNFSGFTGITNYFNYYTTIPKPNDFDCIIGDKIYLNIYSGDTIYSGSSHLIFTSYVRNIQNNYLILDETIPNFILNDLSNCTYLIENLNIANDWNKAFYILKNYTPYVDFYIFDTIRYVDLSGTGYGYYSGITINTKDYSYDKYFDYSDLTFTFDNNSYNFEISENSETSIGSNYINYKLFDRLNQINNTLFTSGFSFFNNYILPISQPQYFYTDSNRIRITTSLTGLTNIFKPYTYINAVAFGESTEKTLVYSVKSNEIIIERPRNWTIYPTQAQLPLITSIQNIDGLKNISDILFEVYVNKTYDWYIQKSDNERKYINRSYAELLQLNEDFRSDVTGILYENDNNEFILKLYDIDNDPNLFFEPIELIYVGVDRKTRLPIPFKMFISTTTTTTLPPTTTTTTLAPTTTTTLPPTTTTTTLAPTITTTTTTISPITTTTTTINQEPIALNKVVSISRSPGFCVNENAASPSIEWFPYTDIDGDIVNAVKILTLPVNGTLTKGDGTPIIVDQILAYPSDFVLLINYTTASITSVYIDTVQFQVRTDNNVNFSNIATLTFNVNSCESLPTTTTTTLPVTTTTTTLPVTTTTTTMIPITTTTTTTISIIYYGVSTSTTVTESEILSTFYTATGNVGLPSTGLNTGRKYIFDNYQAYYKYWCIKDEPDSGDRVIKDIHDENGRITTEYSPYYIYYQSEPNPYNITYGKIIINGILYRVYRSKTSSSEQTTIYVYSYY